MNQSVTRALQIMTALGGEPRSLTELSVQLDVHKSTVLRLLQTLEAERFVTHDAQHTYRLGSRLFELAGQSLEQRDVRTVARPHLEKLNVQTGQTLHLGTYEMGDVVYIDKYDAPQGVRMYSRVGLRMPLHCTALAKVLLAAMPVTTSTAIADQIDYVRMTPQTITSAAGFVAELDRVREAGYAEDREEHESFINCIAAPIRDGSGAVVAAASISVPSISLTYDQVVALLPQLLEAVNATSADLGWTPSLTTQPGEQ
jgi:DNA-binding IclR family transcriptional regulator